MIAESTVRVLKPRPKARNNEVLTVETCDHSIFSGEICKISQEIGCFHGFSSFGRTVFVHCTRYIVCPGLCDKYEWSVVRLVCRQVAFLDLDNMTIG